MGKISRGVRVESQASRQAGKQAGRVGFRVRERVRLCLGLGEGEQYRAGVREGRVRARVSAL